METIIIRSPHGVGRREEIAEKIKIPDLWGIANSLEPELCQPILEVWNLAHDLLDNLIGNVD